MATAPATVHKRPFAVFPLTNVMLPDGIFDVNLGVQRLICHVTNDSGADLANVEVFLESIGDAGAAITAATRTLGTLRAGASVLVAWHVDFSLASPGKKLVSIRVRADGFTRNRSLQRIFVTRTTYDEPSKRFRVEVPEGTFEVSKLGVIGPTHSGWDGPDDRCPPPIGPFLPTHAVMRFTPNPAYSGTHGELPFNDPWWKIVVWIVFAIAAIVAIVAAAAGAGTASIKVGGTFEETDPSINCCKPKVSGEFTVAGVASAIASVAFIVGLADDADPFWRGQEATPPAAGLTTVWEEVDVTFAYTDAPNAGVPYPVSVDWTYTRGLSDGTSATHHVAEVRTNTHVGDGAIVTAPDKLEYRDEWFCVEAQFGDGNGGLFTGVDLYAIALYVSPAGLTFVEMMNDAGHRQDAQPNDGTYTACLELSRAYREHLKHERDIDGWWKVYVYAQDINGATPGQLPEIAAQEIGGVVVAAPVEITFDPTLPCPLHADATTYVLGP
jgi:hypothetical protein